MVQKFSKLTKEETLDKIVKYLSDQLALAERLSEDNESYERAAWSMYQADIIGQKKTLRKILNYLK